MSPMRTTQLRGRLPDAAGAAISSPPAPTAGPARAAADPWLTAEEYTAWLLPPVPRDPMEKAVHALSMGAGAIALAAGIGALWFIL